MASLSLADQFLTFYNEGKYQAVIDSSSEVELTPADDPVAANILAASLFKLEQYSECLLWCESLHSLLPNDENLASMHGAVLRRVGDFEQAKVVFENALESSPDNLIIKNNYANLLIDLRQYADAKSLLLNILEIEPNYNDALQNLNRVNFLLENSSSFEVSSAVKANVNSQLWVSDPLIDAFSDDEVSKMGALNVTQSKGASPFDPSSFASDSPTEELQERITLIRKTLEVDPQTALKDCRQLHKTYGPISALYSLAAEVYIRLKIFQDAENCICSALLLGDESSTNYINLANIAFMRGDQSLASKWLEKAASINANDENLSRVTSQLFPNGKINSTTPFQYDQSAISQGVFK